MRLQNSEAKVPRTKEQQGQDRSIKFTLGRGDARPPQRSGSREVRRLGVQGVKLPECSRVRTRRRHPGVGGTRNGCIDNDNTFDRVARDRGWCADQRDHARFTRFVFVILSNRRNITSTRQDWAKQRCWELVASVAPVTSATAHRYMKNSWEIPRAKSIADVSSSIQIRAEFVRKCEEHLGKNVTMHCDILPTTMEQQLVLEDRDPPCVKQ